MVSQCQRLISEILYSRPHRLWRYLRAYSDYCRCRHKCRLRIPKTVHRAITWWHYCRILCKHEKNIRTEWCGMTSYSSTNHGTTQAVNSSRNTSCYHYELSSMASYSRWFFALERNVKTGTYHQFHFRHQVSKRSFLFLSSHCSSQLSDFC